MNEDLIEVAGKYGAIVNTGVRRRSGRRPPPPTASSAAPISAKISANKVRAEAGQTPSGSTGVSAEAKPVLNSSQSSRDMSDKGVQEKKSLLSDRQLKRESSSIFKSFAKAKPKLQREATDSSVGNSGVDSTAPSGQEDESMKDVSEDEEEDYIPLPQPTSKGVVDADRKSRKEREAALKKMMDEDDPEEQPAPVPEAADPEPSRRDISISPQTEESIKLSDGRRRGRRRIMTKKTIKDEEGYLGMPTCYQYIRATWDKPFTDIPIVTKEEPGWESFSEEEPVPTKARHPASSTWNVEKPKKGSNKSGQGSIMSFFGKK